MKTLAEVREMKRKLAETGHSLKDLCEVLDFLADGATTPYDCCSNPDNNQTRCIQRTFANTFITTPGTPGRCLDTDAFCNAP